MAPNILHSPSTQSINITKPHNFHYAAFVVVILTDYNSLPHPRIVNHSERPALNITFPFNVKSHFLCY